MSDFQWVQGFEEAWRPPVKTRSVRPQAILHVATGPTGGTARARLERLVGGAPEVMVKITGRTRDGAHLRAHLDYTSRNGQLDLEAPDGALVVGRQEVAHLARDWTVMAEADSHRRANSPVSHSIILSMPAGTNEVALHDAARGFAVETFGDRHDYVFALHTDTPRPHVHLTVCSRGLHGERLNPKKADLETWRQRFAQALRDRGVEAEATPRRARGVTLKAEHGPVRRMRERHEAGIGEAPQVRRSAHQDAAKAAFGSNGGHPIWEHRIVARQRQIRGLYLSQAAILKRADDPADKLLGEEVEAFVRAMPAPDSQRLALARKLREANLKLTREPAGDGKERSR